MYTSFYNLSRLVHELIIGKNTEIGKVLGNRSSTDINLVWNIEALEDFENLPNKQ